MKLEYGKQISAWLPLVLWAALIFKLSSGSVPVASPVYWQDFVFKKTAHVVFFGIFSVLSYRALRINRQNSKLSAILAIILTIIYGISDEIHQSFTQTREARVRDVGFDTLGALISMAVLYYVIPNTPEKFQKVFSKLDLHKSN